MASGNECAEATQVLLVDPQSLPVLYQRDPEENTNDISVDLLQQALQGASAMDDGNDGESAEEVSLDALSSGNNDVVAIYQGEEGQTHTIKISLAEAQSLGLQFASDSFPVSLSNGSLVGGLKVVDDQLANGNGSALSNPGLLQTVACSNVASEGRIIDEEGNIVETTEALQILPTTLSSFLDDGLNQSLSIVPQYELDGTVTYAVKLKDQNDAVLGPDYHVLEPDSSAKTGLDIEEELKNSTLKQSILHSSSSIPRETIELATSVALSSGSGTNSSTIQVPMSTFEALSKQMLLPVSTSTVPLSVTLSIPTDTSVSSLPNVSTSNSLVSSNSSRFFQIMSDRNSVGLNNVISTNASVPLGTIVSQPTLAVHQQHSQLIAPSTTMLNVQNSPAVTILGNNRSIGQPGPRQQNYSNRLQPILPCPKNPLSTSLKTVSALKKLPTAANIVAPAAVTTASIHTPAMASVAPSTTQPNFGGASVSKSASNSRGSSSTSNSSKPLGSSENPIQLVQQGQTFHSMQALSQAQLRQIATVLQQKHLNSNSAATKNVLFDEQTKTRIVYRVVYPEDVDLQQPSSPTEVSGSSVSQLNKNFKCPKGKAGRPLKGRRLKHSGKERLAQKNDQTSPSVDTSNSQAGEDSRLSEEAPKIEKKKILGSRTRSGRVSRPPRHMMKDYKRLHHTDLRERDGDDSDGGYSDYSNPEQLTENPPPKEVAVNFSPVKKRISRFTCPTCEKLYLGVGRMEKHFLQHPDHGSFEEFKQNLAASTPTEINAGEEGPEGKDISNTSGKSHTAKGKKRSPGPNQSDKERSEMRKKRLKQALQACEISEIIEVAGPIIARYYSLWDLLLLRLLARDESNAEKETSEDTTGNTNNIISDKGKTFNSQSLHTSKPTDEYLRQPDRDASQNMRSTSNRVQWLLMELSSLTDTLQSVAGDLFQPTLMHGDEQTPVEINQKTLSEMLGVSCGIYNVNEDKLFKRMESASSKLKLSMNEDSGAPPEKRSRKLIEASDLNLSVSHEDPVCPDSLSSLSLMIKPVDEDKVMLAKLTEDMPFLNSSDDMICGGDDTGLSIDGKHDQKRDAATGLQVVDEIVNERLNNLSDNMNFSVPLQSALETSDINEEQSDLHLISSFGGANSSISVSNSSVISSSLTDSNKPSTNVSNMDLMSSYSISSLSRPGAHDVNISNSEPSNDLTSALEPVTSQTMLSSFGMGLSSLSSFDALQSQSSAVSHSEDSFLESLSSFETPLTQSCNTSSAPGASFDDGVMKTNAMLQLGGEPSEPSRLPPKFISSFTPAIANDKSSTTISTAQRLQRTYLELDSGLDDGLDLDFEAFTQELSMNRINST